MYSNVKPVERRNLINAWNIPAAKNIIVIKPGRCGVKIKDAFVSIDIKRGQVSFYTNAIKMLDAKIDDTLGFTYLSGALYIHRSKLGNKVKSKSDGGYRVVSHELANILTEKLHVHKTLRCPLKQTRARFDDQIMYEIILPKYYSKYLN